ncbi:MULTISPECIES: ABC transporter ATP-binding protein [Dictyoglomus]|jgi:peptide/nickel transport system ATP-binding protein|uniref:Oligopeptide/dipeptide ABC transporter, ATPase subunit n=1 Tax=Dictyoglomus turgidum (strain DSM 6724 / Z-1310) TaxID=515635 RepID=B8DZM0_DICTD|nr:MULTISPECIES: ABC transporter ATP-binding protein [Dictyoglomus]ACK41953.1 oligopeptide/dipeptide ABC transporter, ATPase subunit [Dictyoglomus turgidum DSM 6724]PNV79223.1 MAG: ABC transporter ATP-binding protein [Dictyoglomus turgidum]HBU31487.1 ABC transporter ATP-binding protein [Dictyoglomus sp.]
MPELLVVKNLKKYFPVRRKFLKAVDNVSFSLEQGETLGLVGESGSGKSTLGRSILRLIEPDDGEIIFDGVDIRKLRGEELRQRRRFMQIIFQDPLASLNPMMTIGQNIEDPLIIHNIGTKEERRRAVEELLEIVGLGREVIDAFPHEFSGGQQQRVGIARALALNPKFIVADEPVSSLDVSIQAQIVSLLYELKRRFKISYLFISHDLAVVRYLSDKVAVMYLGAIVEMAPKEELYQNPLHPYTRALLASVPKMPRDGERQKRFPALKGEIPSPIDLPPGCRFQSRCEYVMDVCRKQEPAFREVSPGHFVACHLV